MFKYTLSRRTLPAWAALGIGLLASGGAGFQVRQNIRAEAVRQFAFSCDQLVIQVRERLESYELILRGAAALLTVSPDVDRHRWRAYVERLGAETIVPGVQGIGFSRVIAPGELAAHVAAVRGEGFPDYSVQPEGERPLYTSIVYLEPFRDRNLRAFGYDMFSEPVRRAAMEHARDTGATALSGKVRLMQEDGTEVQPGILMYVPVYRSKMPTGTVDERRAALFGWSYSPYRMNDLMSGILKGWQSEEGKRVALRIVDEGAATSGALLFESAGAQPPESDSLFRQRRSIDFYGHPWRLEFSRIASAPGLEYGPAWATVVGGAALSGLLFALLMSLIDIRERAARIARERTAEILEREQQLQQSRTELEDAQRIAHVGNWILDPATNAVTWSPELYRIFGLAPGNAAPALYDQRSLFAPESWDALEGAVRRALETGTGYELELEMIRADGSHGWLQARGEVGRDPQTAGTLLRGIAADITERKRDRIRIERLSRFYAALSECNAAIVHCDSQDELFARICEVVVRHGGMKMAWIGVIDEPSGRIVPVCWHGTGTEYLDGIEISVHADDPHGHGPTGIAARENRPVWFDDFERNARTAPWRERSRPFGWKSSAALPISRAGHPIGALTFYSTAKNWFDEEIRDLLEEMTAQFAFALDKFDAENAARSYHATLIESEQRFQSLVEQAIAGAFILQDGRFAYANPRTLEILGYPSGDALIGRALADIIDPKDRPGVEAMLQAVSEGRSGSTESVFTALRHDGTRVEVGANAAQARYQSRPAVIGMLQDTTDRRVADAQIKRYAAQLERTFMQTVGLATTISELRDPYTAGHEQRVAEIAMAIGRELGLPEDRLEGLRVGGHLHDVGKITIPSEILAKPTRLTKLEYQLIQEHARAGYEVLKEVEFPWPVAQIALQHHERFDGSGYPQGLKGEAIILEARIVAVADVIESMASHRPYRPGLGIERALAEIERGAGTSYDPAVAGACLRLFREKGYAIQALTD